nr:MAG: hypothetical protein [Bacteriophage sp.]
MILEFRVINLKDSSKYLKSMLERSEMLRKQNNLRHEMKNEFIIVGEEIVDGKEYFKVNQLNEHGLSIFGELDLATISLTIPKEEFIWDGTLYTELDIPKENLTLDLIDDIKRLND